jgi:hypothetical protein
VTDEAGNVSTPAVVEVVIRDLQKPTAVLDAPRQVETGQSFQLSGSRSTDIAPGPDCPLSMDDAVLKIVSKPTVTTVARQQPLRAAGIFAISFLVRKSGLDQQI